MQRDYKCEHVEKRTVLTVDPCLVEKKKQKSFFLHSLPADPTCGSDLDSQSVVCVHSVDLGSYFLVRVLFFKNSRGSNFDIFLYVFFD